MVPPLPKATTKLLKEWIASTQYTYPSRDEYDELQAKTNLTRQQLKNWFANSRRRSKPSATDEVEKGAAVGAHQSEWSYAQQPEEQQQQHQVPQGHYYYQQQQQQQHAHYQQQQQQYEQQQQQQQQQVGPVAMPPHNYYDGQPQLWQTGMPMMSPLSPFYMGYTGPPYAYAHPDYPMPCMPPLHSSSPTGTPYYYYLGGSGGGYAPTHSPGGQNGLENSTHPVSSAASSSGTGAAEGESGGGGGGGGGGDSEEGKGDDQLLRKEGQEQAGKGAEEEAMPQLKRGESDLDARAEQPAEGGGDGGSSSKRREESRLLKKRRVRDGSGGDAAVAAAGDRKAKMPWALMGGGLNGTVSLQSPPAIPLPQQPPSFYLGCYPMDLACARTHTPPSIYHNSSSSSEGESVLPSGGGGDGVISGGGVVQPPVDQSVVWQSYDSASWSARSSSAATSMESLSPCASPVRRVLSVEGKGSERIARAVKQMHNEEEDDDDDKEDSTDGDGDDEIGTSSSSAQSQGGPHSCEAGQQNKEESKKEGVAPAKQPAKRCAHASFQLTAPNGGGKAADD